MQANAIPSAHTDGDRARNDAGIRNQWILFGAWTLIAVAAIVFALIWRAPTQLNNPHETASKWICIGATLLWGLVLIFVWSMKMTPRLAYRRYMRDLVSGLSRRVEGVVKQVSPDLTFRDGLYFYALLVNVGDPNEAVDDRLLYWDAQKGTPPASQGDTVLVNAHGNDIIGLLKGTP